MKLETDVGRLNKRITIQQLSAVDEFDTIGNQLPGWTDYHSCWAAITGGKGSESQQAREPKQKVEKNFKIRYCVKLENINDINYRIKYKNQYYDIKDIDNISEADSLLIIRAALED